MASDRRCSRSFMICRRTLDWSSRSDGSSITRENCFTSRCSNLLMPAFANSFRYLSTNALSLGPWSQSGMPINSIALSFSGGSFFRQLLCFKCWKPKLNFKFHHAGVKLLKFNTSIMLVHQTNTKHFISKLLSRPIDSLVALSSCVLDADFFVFLRCTWSSIYFVPFERSIYERDWPYKKFGGYIGFKKATVLMSE